MNFQGGGGANGQQQQQQQAGGTPDWAALLASQQNQQQMQQQQQGQGMDSQQVSLLIVLLLGWLGREGTQERAGEGVGWFCWGGARWHTLLVPRSLSFSPPGSNLLSLDVSRTRACSSYWLGPNTDGFTHLPVSALQLCGPFTPALLPLHPSSALSHPARSTLTGGNIPLRSLSVENPAD